MYSFSSLRSSLGFFSHGGLKNFSRYYYFASPNCLENLKGGLGSPGIVAAGENAKHMLPHYGNLGMNLSLLAAKDHISALCTLRFQSFIHSAGPKSFEMGSNSKPMDFSGGQRDFEMGRNSRPMDFSAGRRDFEMGRNSRPMDLSAGRKDFEIGRNSRPMDFVRGIIKQDGSQLSRLSVDQNADIVLIKLKRRKTFVTVMDSKGNTKNWMNVGRLEEKDKVKLSRYYSAEATAEGAGRMAREMGLKSFVMRVNGFTHFKKKRQAIMSFREGFSQSRSGENPIVYIEDTTRRPHNGCRLPKKRRI